MNERERALLEVLGSVRLEGAEPSPEVRAALERWAVSEDGIEALNALAVQAARGAVRSPASTRAA